MHALGEFCIVIVCTDGVILITER